MSKHKKKHKKAEKRATRERLIAVIDIGSNSVRLVVFKGLKRTPDILFNERVLCGLGRSVSSTGNMDNASMSLALSTLARFGELCRDMRVDEIDAVATSAVRDAQNGKDFIKAVEKTCGFPVKVISGRKEAKYSALGVIAGFPGAAGIVGDLGGGSLELIRLIDGEMKDRVTLPIGPVRLQGLDVPEEKYLSIIHKALYSVDWLTEGYSQPFYMVGGAWRALARLHMKNADWPLPVLHGYAIEGEEAYRFADLISQQSVESLSAIPEIADRRVEVIPLASSILREVLSIQKPDRVLTSANGIREGLLFSKLNHKARAQDPLLASCKEIADRKGRFPEHANTLMEWINPLFEGESEEDNRLRFVACQLSDIAWQKHPDFRAEHAFYDALLGYYTGIDHRGRALLGLTLYMIYGGPLNGPYVLPALRLLSENDIRRAEIMGAALRLGQRLTGGTTRPLTYSRIEVARKYLTLYLPEKYDDMAGEVVRKRLLKLSGLLGVEAEIRYS